MTHRSNGAAITLPFRCDFSAATAVLQSLRYGAAGTNNQPQAKELATTSRGCGSNVKPVSGVYCTGRVAPTLPFRSGNTQEA